MKTNKPQGEGLKVMTSLTDYLANLNTSESQWSLYVNPQNIEEYRTGQDCFENGGLDDGFVCVGSLESLSYGFQSTHDAIESLLDSGEIKYKGRKVLVNANGILDAYSNGNLDNDFQEFLEAECEEMKAVRALNDAELKVEELEQYFTPGGEYEEECRLAHLEAEAWESASKEEQEKARIYEEGLNAFLYEQQEAFEAEYA